MRALGITLTFSLSIACGSPARDDLFSDDVPGASPTAGGGSAAAGPIGGSGGSENMATAGAGGQPTGTGATGGSSPCQPVGCDARCGFVDDGCRTTIDCGACAGGGSTCTDGVANGDETGVDCGGSCAPCALPPDGVGSYSSCKADADCAATEVCAAVRDAGPYDVGIGFCRAGGDAGTSSGCWCAARCNAATGNSSCPNQADPSEPQCAGGTGASEPLCSLDCTAGGICPQGMACRQTWVGLQPPPFPPSIVGVCEWPL